MKLDYRLGAEFICECLGHRFVPANSHSFTFFPPREYDAGILLYTEVVEWTDQSYVDQPTDQSLENKTDFSSSDATKFSWSNSDYKLKHDASYASDFFRSH